MFPFRDLAPHLPQLVARARNSSALLPPGAQIDYAHGPSRGYEIVVSSAITIAAASVLVITRLVIKIFVVHSPGWDDYLSVVALGFAIARVVGNVILVNKYGVGHHLYDVQPQHFHHLLSWYQVDDVLYLFAIMFAKISILILYLRLFKVNRLFRYVDFAMMALVIGYCTSLLLAILFGCQPLARVWNSSIPGKCLNLTAIDFTIGGFNIFTDTAILVLPLPLVWNLHVTRARMIGLVAIFATGTFVVITSVVREIICVRTLKDIDQTWSMVDDIVWLTVEVNMGIFCSCLPLLPPLFRQVPTKEVIASKYHSWVSLLRSGDSRKSAANSQNATSWPSRPSDAREEEYLELVDDAKADTIVTPGIRGDVPREKLRPRTEIQR